MERVLYRKYFRSLKRISSRQAHYEILSGVYGLTKDMSTTWDLRHIKQHQDNDKTHVLDRWACLNIECDYRAKMFLRI